MAYFNAEIVVAADALVDAVARLGRTRTGKRIVPAGTRGHAKVSEPYIIMGFADQRDLSLWRSHEPTTINDRNLRYTEQLKRFLEEVATTSSNGTEADSDTNPLYTDMVAWVRENRIEEAQALDKLLASYLNRLARGAGGNARATTATLMIHLSDISKHPHPTRINRIEFSQCGSYMAECADDGVLNLYSARLMSIIGSVNTRDTKQETKNRSAAKFYSVEFNHDGSRFATASTDGNAIVWNTDSRARHGGPFAHPAAVTDVSFSPDGNQLAVACDNGCIYVWEIEAERLIHELKLHTSYVRSVNFSRDGLFLVSSGLDQIAVLWDLKKNRPQWAWGQHGGTLYDAILIPKKDAIATACIDGCIRVFSTETGLPCIKQPLFQGGWINSLCASKDGTRILAASRAGTVSIWNWKEEKELFSLTAAGRTLRAARFSPDEQSVITGGYDGVVSIWRIPNQRAVAPEQGR